MSGLVVQVSLQLPRELSCVLEDGAVRTEYEEQIESQLPKRVGSGGQRVRRDPIELSAGAGWVTTVTVPVQQKCLPKNAAAEFARCVREAARDVIDDRVAFYTDRDRAAWEVCVR